MQRKKLIGAMSTKNNSIVLGVANNGSRFVQSGRSGSNSFKSSKDGNQDQNEVMVFIKCKHAEHMAQKELLDPCAHMVFIAQQWNKIAEELQKMVQSKVPRNNKMCKDKWNQLNFNYKKLSNYHQGIGHHTSFQELFKQECDQCHLPWAFSRKAYEAFQGECIINAHVHVRDLQAKGDGN